MASPLAPGGVQRVGAKPKAKMQQGSDETPDPMKLLVLDQARSRWLTTMEVLDIITNRKKYGLPILETTPWRAPSGTICVYNRNIIKSYRKDGYAWKRQADNRSNGSYRVLKIDGENVLRCSYTYTEDGGFQLRVHSLVDKSSEFAHLSVAQYRDVGQRSARARAASEAVAAGKNYMQRQRRNRETVLRHSAAATLAKVAASSTSPLVAPEPKKLTAYHSSPLLQAVADISAKEEDGAGGTLAKLDAAKLELPPSRVSIGTVSSGKGVGGVSVPKSQSKAPTKPKIGRPKGSTSTPQVGPRILKKVQKQLAAQERLRIKQEKLRAAQEHREQQQLLRQQREQELQQQQQKQQQHHHQYHHHQQHQPYPYSSSAHGPPPPPSQAHTDWYAQYQHYYKHQPLYQYPPPPPPMSYYQSQDEPSRSAAPYVSGIPPTSYQSGYQYSMYQDRPDSQFYVPPPPSVSQQQQQSQPQSQEKQGQQRNPGSPTGENSPYQPHQYDQYARHPSLPYSYPSAASSSGLPPPPPPSSMYYPPPSQAYRGDYYAPPPPTSQGYPTSLSAPYADPSRGLVPNSNTAPAYKNASILPDSSSLDLGLHHLMKAAAANQDFEAAGKRGSSDENQDDDQDPASPTHANKRARHDKDPESDKPKVKMNMAFILN